MIPVDVVPRVSNGRLVIGIWIGQSWPQQDYVTTLILWVPALTLVLQLAYGCSCIRITSVSITSNSWSFLTSLRRWSTTIAGGTMQSVFLLAVLIQLYLLNVAHGLSLSDFSNKGDSPQVPPVLCARSFCLNIICTKPRLCNNQIIIIYVTTILLWPTKFYYLKTNYQWRVKVTTVFNFTPWRHISTLNTTDFHKSIPWRSGRKK